MNRSPISARGSIKRIAVFRALNLGDLLCSIPAFRALRRAFPSAHITLIGLPSARPVVERFGHYVDELVLFPGDEAFPEQAARTAALPEFYASMRARRFDIAVQLHGSGLNSNPVVEKLGARWWAGFVPHREQEEAGRLLAWPDTLPEIHRYLALLRFIGLRADDATLEFPLSPTDQAEAAAVVRDKRLNPARTIFVHPGARLLSRRWPVDRFIAVSAHLAAQGWHVAVTGSADEEDLVQRLVENVPGAVDLSGTTSLGGLAALLTQGRLLICNDTGVSHIAAAVGVPSVVIASGSDVNRWAPLDTRKHHVLHAAMPCRPCAHYQCPIGHGCALAITQEDVVSQAQRLLHRQAA